VLGSLFKDRRSPFAGVRVKLPGGQRGFVSIGQTPPGSSSFAGDRAADLSLMLALLLAALSAGGGIYEAFVLFPAWLLRRRGAPRLSLARAARGLR
jgi:hypothetical protein